MKTMLIVSMFSLLLIACDNYEFIKENQRFNKRTGEVETLDSNFEWWSLSKLRDAEKKRERARQKRDALAIGSSPKICRSTGKYWSTKNH